MFSFLAFIFDWVVLKDRVGSSCSLSSDCTLPVFNFNSENYDSLFYILIPCQSHVANIFSQFLACCIFIFSVVSFDEQKFLILTWLNLLTSYVVLL